MANSIFEFLDTSKKASFYGGGANLKPMEPFPNSIAAKQMEQQELAAEAANNPENQLQQTQKAQQDAVNQLQQAQQQIQQLQGELQNSQATSQQQAQQAQMQAQQEIQKAQMDAQYELQAEKIKNQKALLSMQEKYMKGMQKQPKDQGGILANQLKRVVSRVSKVAREKKANVLPPPPQPWSALGAAQKQQYLQSGDKSLWSQIPDFFAKMPSEIGDYWRNPSEYIGYNNPTLKNQEGDIQVSDMSGYLGGGKGINTNLTEGNYGRVAGNLLGAVPDLFLNNLSSGAVRTGQGLSDIAKGNIGGGLANAVVGGLQTAAGLSPAGILKPKPSAVPGFMKLGPRAIGTLTRPASAATKVLSTAKKSVIPTLNAMDLYGNIKKSNEVYGSNMTPAQIIQQVDSAISEAELAHPGVSDNTPYVPAAPSNIDYNNILDKGKDAFKWLGTPMAPNFVRTGPLPPMHRTNLEFLQGTTDYNNAWAHPMVGNENTPNLGKIPNLIGSTLGAFFPSLKVGRPAETANITKSLSYAPTYKLNTSSM
jgi:hypothetical protein